MSTAKKFSLEHSLGVVLPETFASGQGKTASLELDPVELPLKAFSAKILPFGSSIKPLKEPKNKILTKKEENLRLEVHDSLSKKISVKEAIEIYNEILNASFKVSFGDEEFEICNNEFCGTLINKKHY